MSATEIHACLEAALRELQRAERNAVLLFGEILRRKLYRDLGYSSIQAYAAESLGFTPSKISQFVRLAGALEELPCLRRSVASGELGWTKAREVAKVVAAIGKALAVEGWPLPRPAHHRIPVARALRWEHIRFPLSVHHAYPRSTFGRNSLHRNYVAPYCRQSGHRPCIQIFRGADNHWPVRHAYCPFDSCARSY